MRRIISSTAGAAVVAAGLSLAIPGGAALASHAAPPARAAVRGGALPVIKVAMNGKKITVSGALQSGGVKVVSTVTGEPAGAPTFIRLDRGVTVARLLKAIQGDPNSVALVASIVFSPPAAKGTSSAQVSLAPGRYVALDATSRTPPLTTFTIAKASSPATLPKPEATVSSIEFGFRGPGTLHNGELVRFANHGFLVHMIVAGRGASRVGAGQDREAAEGGQGRRGPAPGHRLHHVLQHLDPRRLPAAGGPRPAGLLGAGLLPVHPRRPRAHPARHGAGHPHHRVAAPFPHGCPRPAPRAGRGAIPARSRADDVADHVRPWNGVVRSTAAAADR